MVFDDYFDAVCVISLPWHGERLERCLAQLREAGLSKEAVVFPAVQGRQEVVPSWWRAGAAAWGCYQSHRQLLQKMLAEGWERLLVVEDDAVWQQGDGGARAAEFLAGLPEGWEQVYLGGVHQLPAEPTGHPAVVRGRSVNRTHAYGVTAAGARKILRFFDERERYKGRPKGFKGHVDHWMELGHQGGLWSVYAPSFWLCGQGGGDSALMGKEMERGWWHGGTGLEGQRLPVVVLREDWEEEAGPELRRLLVVDEYWQQVSVRWQAESVLTQQSKKGFRHQRLPAVPVEKLEWVPKRRRVVELAEVERELEWMRACPFVHPWLNPRRRAVEVPAVEVVEAADGGEPVPFVIFSTPRSRSTLLMRILNESPRVRCGGERKDLLWRLKSLHDLRAELMGDSPRAFWPLEKHKEEGTFASHMTHGAAEDWDEVPRRGLRAWLGVPEGAEGVEEELAAYGLKDVFVGRAGVAAGVELWDWMARVWPRMRFIFLTRDFEQTVASMASKQAWFVGPGRYGSCMADCERGLRRQRDAFAEYALLNPTRCVSVDAAEVLDYEVLAERLARVSVPVGREAHAAECAVKMR